MTFTILQGEGYYAVRLIVQERKNGDPILQEANVLGRLSAINAKKIDQPNPQVGSEGAVALKHGGQFGYSIADLINDVKNIFPDTFSKDVYNHFEMQRVENKTLTPLRYQKKRNIAPIESADLTKLEKHFGTTGNFKVAGYLLTNGKLLDFSGKHWGDTTSRTRQVDHRDVQEVLDDRGDNGFNAMIDMIGNGNIRLMPETGGTNLAV